MVVVELYALVVEVEFTRMWYIFYKRHGRASAALGLGVFWELNFYGHKSLRYTGTYN